MADSYKSLTRLLIIVLFFAFILLPAPSQAVTPSPASLFLSPSSLETTSFISCFYLSRCCVGDVVMDWIDLNCCRFAAGTEFSLVYIN